MRPCVGNEFLFTRQFPENVQGQFTYSCVINMNGMPRFNVRDKSAGFVGERIMAAGADKDGKPVPDDLLRSTDKNFRPVDAQIGPDGALWFGDWCNALIGHMQYSQRDPNRDHTRGRIYRLVYTKNKLLEPVTQYGKSESELLDQPRVRVADSLSGPAGAARPAEGRRACRREEVGSAPSTRRSPNTIGSAARCFGPSRANMPSMMGGSSRSFVREDAKRRAAAAMHVAADEFELLPSALELLSTGVRDESPRVGWKPSADSASSPRRQRRQRPFPFSSYRPIRGSSTHWSIRWSLESQWKEAYQSGTFANDDRAKQFIQSYIARVAPLAWRPRRRSRD